MYRTCASQYGLRWLCVGVGCTGFARLLPLLRVAGAARATERVRCQRRDILLFQSASLGPQGVSWVGHGPGSQVAPSSWTLFRREETRWTTSRARVLGGRWWS